ncbi:MAG: cytochrome c3 family protein [Pirellulaceae bacterium]
MAQIFHPAANALARGTIFGAVFILAAVVWAGSVWMRSPYVTRVNVVRDQPVPFSHDHHVAGLGIDCRFCHATVETSAFAGMPSTETCMGCHSQIWNKSPLLAPVRESYQNGTPLAWTRVYDMPDYVYFNHSIHVAKGIGCESCHGRVDRMPLMRKAVAMHMEWCLDCHRHPETAVRPRGEVFRFGQGPEQTVEGSRLVREYAIAKQQLTDCVICHR